MFVLARWSSLIPPSGGTMPLLRGEAVPGGVAPHHGECLRSFLWSPVSGRTAAVAGGLHSYRIGKGPAPYIVYAGELYLLTVLG